MNRYFLFSIISILVYHTAFSQNSTIEGRVNTITSAVPFLMIAPDARAGALGDAGVASSPDVNSIHWNPAKLKFIETKFGIGVSYTPWLKELVDDIDLSYISGYAHIDDRQAIGFSLRYFSLGNIAFTNIHGQKIRDYRPNEFAVDVAYSLLLSENLSSGVGLRYINSNLMGGFSDGTEPTHPGRAVAADLSLYYQKPIEINQKDNMLALGMAISNIGNRISYTDEGIKNFLPINMRLGGAFTSNLDEYNSLTFLIDFNKLLVPTPGYLYTDQDGNDSIVGQDPAKISEISVANGIFGSFSDAPNGFSEELQEIAYSFGVEYWYAKQFAIRAGYFHEHENKGNRKYATFGVGLKLNVFSLDFAYLIPTKTRNHPLANTVRFSLLFNFNSFTSQK